MLLGAGLNHGNILKLLGFIQKGTYVYMVRLFDGVVGERVADVWDIGLSL
jgi:hypothetical protein